MRRQFLEHHRVSCTLPQSVPAARRPLYTPRGGTCAHGGMAGKGGGVWGVGGHLTAGGDDQSVVRHGELQAVHGAAGHLPGGGPHRVGLRHQVLVPRVVQRRLQPTIRPRVAAASPWQHAHTGSTGVS